MRILDEANDRSMKRVSLYLTPEEARSLLLQLEKLLATPKIHHIHSTDEGLQREITVAVYTRLNLQEFDERSRKLIERDL